MCLFGLELRGTIYPATCKLHVIFFHISGPHDFGLAGLVGAWSLRAEGEQVAEAVFRVMRRDIYDIYIYIYIQNKKTLCILPAEKNPKPAKTHNFFIKS